MAPKAKVLYAPLNRNQKVGPGASSLESTMKRAVTNSDLLTQVQSKLSSTPTIDSLNGSMRIPMFTQCGQNVMYRHAVFAGKIVSRLTDTGANPRDLIDNVIPDEHVDNQVRRIVASCFGIIFEAASGGVMTAIDGIRDVLNPHKLPFDSSQRLDQQIASWAQALHIADGAIQAVGDEIVFDDAVLAMAFLHEYCKLALAIATVSRTTKTTASGSNKMNSLSRVSGIALSEGFLRTSDAVQFGISSLFQFGSEFVILLTYMAQNSNNEVSRVSNFILGYLSDRGNWVIKTAINLLVIGRHPVVALRELEAEVRALVEIGERAATLPGGLEFYSITVEGLQGRGMNTLSKISRNLGGIKYVLNELFPQVTKLKRAFSTEGEILSDALIEKVAAFQGSQRGATAIGEKILGTTEATDQVDYLTHALSQLAGDIDGDEDPMNKDDEDSD